MSSKLVPARSSSRGSKTSPKFEHNTIKRDKKVSDEESKVKSMDTIVSPFEASTQYFLHLLVGLKPDEAIILTIVKQAAMKFHPDSQLFLKEKSKVKTQELQELANSHKKTVSETTLYAGDITAQNAPSLAPFVQLANVMVPNTLNYDRVVSKFAPDYEIRPKLKATHVETIAKQVIPILVQCKILGIKPNADIMTEITKNACTAFGVAMEKKERKLVLTHAISCFTMGYHQLVNRETINTLCTQHDLALAFKASGLVSAVGMFHIQFAFSVIVDTMISDDYANMLPAVIHRGLLKLANRQLSNVDMKEDELDQDIIISYVYALVINKEFKLLHRSIASRLYDFKGDLLAPYISLFKKHFVEMLQNGNYVPSKVFSGFL